MRLTDQQHVAIRATVSEGFLGGALVRLFGSRVDNRKYGDDIDLLIEMLHAYAVEIARAEIDFHTKLQSVFGKQKIDVLLAYPSRKSYPPKSFMQFVSEFNVRGHYFSFVCVCFQRHLL
jgi:hypothetical protein